MGIQAEQVQGTDGIYILKIDGELDSTNFQELMKEAEKAVEAGACCLLLDMSDLRFMSSAGLAALHSLTLMMQKVQPPQEDRVKLVNPGDNIRKILDMTGFIKLYEIYEDREAALAACSM